MDSGLRRNDTVNVAAVNAVHCNSLGFDED
jgi:hypothetical protein